MTRPAGDGRPITTLLRAWARGDESARDAIVSLAYDDLRRQAASHLRRERKDHTLEPAALVNETFLRLARGVGIEWQDRLHFFAVASQVMRRVLVDHARGRAAAKRGGGQPSTVMDDALAWCAQRNVDLIAMDDALSELAQLDARQAQVVELRFFGGLSVEETAAALDISTATVKREWRMARAWLYRRMTSPE